MKLYPKILLAQKIILAIGLFVFLGLIVIPVIASDRFINNGDGTVTDTKTGLMWSVEDNGKHINWHDARSYCQSYSGGNHADWRMPTLEELKTLYEPVILNDQGYHINTAVGLTAESCWASDTRGNEAARYNFTYGQEYWLRQYHSGSGRVLPVRSSK
jgi:hypothetical protein